MSVSSPNCGHGVQSSTDILSLPHELLLDISQHLGPQAGLVAPSNRMGGGFDGDLPYLLNNERHRTLRSLSQCCRHLRSFFLPLAWEYFYICCTNGSSSQPLPQDLRSKSMALTKYPDLAAYVHVVNVDLAIFPSVLSTFAQCLQSLPNLHTLQIAKVSGPLTTAIKTTFKRRRFLQIHTIILPSIAYHILGSCPRVKDVTLIGYQENCVFRTIKKRCKMVEALDIRMYSNDTLDSVVKAMPNLYSITIRLYYNHNDVDADGISILSVLPHLHTITICEVRRSLTNILPEDDVEARLQPLVIAGVNVLKKHKGDKDRQKWVRVWHRTTYGARMAQYQFWMKTLKLK